MTKEQAIAYGILTGAFAVMKKNGEYLTATDKAEAEFAENKRGWEFIGQPKILAVTPDYEKWRIEE